MDLHSHHINAANHNRQDPPGNPVEKHVADYGAKHKEKQDLGKSEEPQISFIFNIFLYISVAIRKDQNRNGIRCNVYKKIGLR